MWVTQSPRRRWPRRPASRSPLRCGRASPGRSPPDAWTGKASSGMAPETCSDHTGQMISASGAMMPPPGEVQKTTFSDDRRQPPTARDREVFRRILEIAAPWCVHWQRSGRIASLDAPCVAANGAFANPVVRRNQRVRQEGSFCAVVPWERSRWPRARMSPLPRRRTGSPSIRIGCSPSRLSLHAVVRTPGGRRPLRRSGLGS